MIVLPTCSTWWLLSSLRIDRLGPGGTPFATAVRTRYTIQRWICWRV